MTLTDLLSLARSLAIADRRVLAEEMWRSLDEEPVDPEVLRLVQQCRKYSSSTRILPALGRVSEKDGWKTWGNF